MDITKIIETLEGAGDGHRVWWLYYATEAETNTARDTIIELIRDLKEEWDEGESLDYPAFSAADLDKASMQDHLFEVHGLRDVHGKALGPSRVGLSKATKDEMVETHNRIHAAQDAETAELAYWGRRSRTSYGNQIELDREFLRANVALGGYPLPRMRHSHSPVVLSDEAQAVRAGIARRDNTPVADKPLPAGERKVLTELVNNDFNGLKQEMKAFMADVLRSTFEEIDAEWRERMAKTPDFAGQATSLKRKQDDEWGELRARHAQEQRDMQTAHTDALKAITDKAADEGITLSGSEERAPIDPLDPSKGSRTVTIYSAKAEGREKALKEAEAQNKKDLDRALMTLEGQRLAAQRKVLVAGVSMEAAGILEQIPDARTLMQEAAQVANRQIEASSD